MKKLSVLLLALVTFVGFNACTSDDDVVFIAQPDPEGIIFVNDFNQEYVLTPATRSNVAERFVWNRVDFGVPTNITYEVQGSTDPEFASFDVIGATSGNNLAVTVMQMMSLAMDAGLDADPITDNPNTGQIHFRVRAFAGNGGGNPLVETSEPQAITVVLPEATGDEEPELPKIYMVGNFQSAGGYGSNWTPADGVPLAASAEGATDYEGYVFINSSSPEFKFLPTNESFDGDYGDSGSTNGDFTGTLLQDGEVNAGTPDGTGGYYLVKVNLAALTYSLTKITTWGVIGNATPGGWDNDTPMTYDPAAKIWKVTLNLTQKSAPDDGLKFRANNDWALNYGDTEADGSLEPGGTNIGVPENGNYTVTLDLSEPRRYTYSLTKN